MNWYVDKKKFNYFVKVVPKVFKASNLPIVTWQNTSSPSMKLMTKTNVSNPILHIQNSNVTMVMTHFAMVENTYISIFLLNIIEICFRTNSLREGNMTKCHNQGFSTIHNGMYPLQSTKPNLQKITIDLDHLVYKGLGPKKMNDGIGMHCFPFFPFCWPPLTLSSVNYFCYLYWFIVTPCSLSTCFFIFIMPSARL